MINDLDCGCTEKVSILAILHVKGEKCKWYFGIIITEMNFAEF